MALTITLQALRAGFVGSSYAIDPQTGKPAENHRDYSASVPFGAGSRSDLFDRGHRDNETGVYFAQLYQEQQSVGSEIGYVVLTGHVRDSRQGGQGGIKLHWTNGVPGDTQAAMDVLNSMARKFRETLLNKDGSFYSDDPQSAFEAILQSVSLDKLRMAAATQPASAKSAASAAKDQNYEFDSANIFVPKALTESSSNKNMSAVQAVAQTAEELIDKFLKGDLGGVSGNLCVSSPGNIENFNRGKGRPYQTVESSAKKPVAEPAQSASAQPIQAQFDNAAKEVARTVKLQSDGEQTIKQLLDIAQSKGPNAAKAREGLLALASQAIASVRQIDNI